MKLLVACVDALDPVRLETHVPTLIGDREVRCRLAAAEPKTWMAWTEFACGSRKHGVQDGVRPKRFHRFWQASDIVPRMPLVHEVLNRLGFSVGVYGLPVVCWPPRPMDGWMYAGGSLYPGRVWPESLIDPRPTRELWGDTWMGLKCARGTPWDSPENEAARAAFKARSLDVLQAEATQAMELCEALPVDVVLWYVSMTDCIQHVLSHDRDHMAAVYEWVADALAGWQESFEPEQVAVVSDHGMKHVKPWEAPRRNFVIPMTGNHRREGVLVYDPATPFGHRAELCAERSQDTTLSMSWLFDMIVAAVDGASAADPATPTPDADEQTRVLERLRDLGYED